MQAYCKAYRVTAARLRHRPDPASMLTRGAALPWVLLLTALMGSLTLNVWRSAITREALANADADRLQARQAARALIREAQQDILALLPDTRHAPGPEGSQQAFYPRDMTAWRELVTRLQRQPGVPCLRGICLALPVVEPSLGTWSSRLPVAATPGQFVARASGDTADPAFTQLYPGAAAYWVEVLPFDPDSAAISSHIDTVPADPSLVYRITAYVQGRWPGTRVVQQVLWLSATAAPERANAPRVLQWREWLE